MSDQLSAVSYQPAVVLLRVVLASAAVAAVVGLTLHESPVEAADTPTAAEILGRIDKNMTFETRTMTIKMTATSANGRARSYTMKAYGRGKDEAAIEYVDPPREAGTRMLRKADELWMYLPSVEKTQKISGHMLRQGMMGTDVSYEDMMNASDLLSQYDAKVTGEGEVDGHKCWNVEMTAKDPSITYAKRVACIDEEHYIALKSDLYAVSGMLLKTWTMSNLQLFDKDRWFPMKMTIEDKLQQGSSTTMEFSDVSFGVQLEDEVFSMRWLERKN